MNVRTRDDEPHLDDHKIADSTNTQQNVDLHLSDTTNTKSLCGSNLTQNVESTFINIDNDIPQSHSQFKDADKEEIDDKRTSPGNSNLYNQKQPNTKKYSCIKELELIQTSLFAQDSTVTQNSPVTKNVANKLSMQNSTEEALIPSDVVLNKTNSEATKSPTLDSRVHPNVSHTSSVSRKTDLKSSSPIARKALIHRWTSAELYHYPYPSPEKHRARRSVMSGVPVTRSQSSPAFGKLLAVVLIMVTIACALLSYFFVTRNEVPLAVVMGALATLSGSGEMLFCVLIFYIVPRRDDLT